MEQLIEQLEQQLAVARLAQALGAVEAVIVRRPAGDAISDRREVVLVVAHDASADSLVSAIRGAAK